jgi:uncharacterized protein YjeT (DUF2065 family)
MDMTTWLASIWGPVLVAVGIGFFASPAFYRKVYRDLENNSFAVLFFGMLAIAVGIMQIQSHNLWESLSEVIISLLGWAILVKGIICVIFPKIAEKRGDWFINHKMIPIAGGVVLLLGLYLSWFAYFM